MISYLFKETEKRQDFTTTIRTSYIEIYNEQILDLIDSTEGKRMDIHESKSGVFVQGASCPIAKGEEEAISLLFEGETNRALAQHKLNATSTRSHCIFTLHLNSVPTDDLSAGANVTTSKLNLVDLAGSERQKRTESTGAVLKEAQYINKSLSFLEQVVIALANKHRDHIPYRQVSDDNNHNNSPHLLSYCLLLQSKLTNVLKDSLGGNCRTTMIACIWPESGNEDQTLATLRFASRMSCIKNEPIVNSQTDKSQTCQRLEAEVLVLATVCSVDDGLLQGGVAETRISVA